MSKYPPGPYKIWRNDDAHTRIDILAQIPDEPCGYVIAKVLPIGYPETDNVANLFAASPDLLAACHDAIFYLFNERGAWGKDEPEAELYRTLVNAVTKVEERRE